jgi:hypothetical protein
MQQQRATRGRYTKSERLLARLGVLVCGTCGKRMSVHSTTARGTRYSYYACGDKLCPRAAVISAPAVEDYVRDEALRIAAEHAADAKGRASLQDDVEAARLAREEAEQALAHAIGTLLGGLEAEPASRAVLDELQAKRDQTADHHERLGRLAADSRTVRASDWDQLSFDERRGIIHATIRRAVVAPCAVRRGPSSVPSERVVIEPRTVSDE